MQHSEGVFSGGAFFGICPIRPLPMKLRAAVRDPSETSSLWDGSAERRKSGLSRLRGGAHSIRSFTFAASLGLPLHIAWLVLTTPLEGNVIDNITRTRG